MIFTQLVDPMHVDAHYITEMDIAEFLVLKLLLSIHKAWLISHLSFPLSANAATSLSRTVASVFPFRRVLKSHAALYGSMTTTTSTA